MPKKPKSNEDQLKDWIETEQVLAWLGSDATIEDCADLLASIANKEYKPADLRQEVSDYHSDEETE
jgi:hypothetical protein